MDKNKKESMSQRKFGALWERSNNFGPYMTGELEIDGKKISIMVWPNKYKEKEEHPDWRIFLHQNEDISVLGQRSVVSGKGRPITKRQEPVLVEETTEEMADDIPPF